MSGCKPLIFLYYGVSKVRLVCSTEAALDCTESKTRDGKHKLWADPEYRLGHLGEKCPSRKESYAKHKWKQVNNVTLVTLHSEYGEGTASYSFTLVLCQYISTSSQLVDHLGYCL